MTLRPRLSGSRRVSRNPIFGFLRTHMLRLGVFVYQHLTQCVIWGLFLIRLELWILIIITNVCKTASYSLWRIGKLRRLLDQIHAFITSKLDYCNSLFWGLYDYQFGRLQHIQNAAARLVVRGQIRRHDDITPVLRELHWLPVVVRVEFKYFVLF